MSISWSFGRALSKSTSSNNEAASCGGVTTVFGGGGFSGSSGRTSTWRTLTGRVLSSRACWKLQGDFHPVQGEEHHDVEDNREQHRHGRPPSEVFRTGQPVGPRRRAIRSMNSRRPWATIRGSNRAGNHRKARLFSRLAPAVLLFSTLNLPTHHGHQKNCKEDHGTPARRTREGRRPGREKNREKGRQKGGRRESRAEATAAQSRPAKPSPDVIARAAYLNYRRRVEQGLPGDSHGDWLEAERYFSSTERILKFPLLPAWRMRRERARSAP